MKIVDKELDKLVNEITDLAENIVVEYKETGSETSGSVTQVHFNSPLLNEEENDE